MGTINLNQFFINEAKRVIQDTSISPDCFANLIKTHLVSVSLSMTSTNENRELLQMIEQSKLRIDSSLLSTSPFDVKIFPAWCDFFKGQVLINEEEREKAVECFQNAKEKFEEVYVTGNEAAVKDGIVNMLTELIKQI